jgi:hypothetical protein
MLAKPAPVRVVVERVHLEALLEIIELARSDINRAVGYLEDGRAGKAKEIIVALLGRMG